MANIYEFELGEINDELVEEYKELLYKYAEKLKDPNMIGSRIAKGELELTDDIVFQSAICFAKEYLKEVLNSGEQEQIETSNVQIIRGRSREAPEKSGAVHKESQDISDKVFLQVVFSGENIVLPKVGADSYKLIDHYIDRSL